MMKTLKYIVLLTVMLVNVTPYIKDGKVEWKANEAAAQYYTIEYDAELNRYECGHVRAIGVFQFYSTIQCEDLSDSQHFEKENISEAYEYFSDAATSNPIEQGGFLLEDGSIFIISDANNAADTTRYPKLNDKNNDGYAYIALPPDGRLLKVFGIIHTHPNKNTAGYEYKPKSPEDWNSLASIGGNHPDHRIDIQGYIYTPDGIYTYWFQSDGTRSYMDPNRNYFHNQ